MRQKNYILLVVFSLLAIFPHILAAQANTATKIILIRHGEKPQTGDNLSCQGLNRSLQLPKVLYGKFGMPDMVYVPSVKTGKSTSHARMLQTVTPFAVQYNLTVNSKFAQDDYQGISAELLKKHGTQILVWEHAAIKGITAALGIKDKLKWPDSDFDSIWIISFPKGVATLTKDKEGLNPSAECAH